MNKLKVTLRLMVAMTPQRIIGRDGRTPWERIPSDMARFRQVTKGIGTVVMGRKTYDSIVRENGRALPDRHSIVLTTGTQFEIDDLETTGSVEETLRLVEQRGGEACVIGGGEIYRLFMPHAQLACVTTVLTDAAGDTHFPEFGDDWVCIDDDPVPRIWDERDPYLTTHEVWMRNT